MESVQPPAGSQVSRVPAQRLPPDPVVPPPVAPAPAPRRRWPLVLVLVGAVLTVLCVAGAALAYVLYDRYTAPDRSAPDAVVDRYLRAYLVDRNDVLTAQFLCEGNPELDQIRALRAEVERREREFDVRVKVVWGALDRSKTESGETIQTTLRIGGYNLSDGRNRSNRRERWRFDLVNRDGWRVCGASRVG